MTLDLTQCGLSFIWGAVLGLFYFGGLWFTVKRLPGKNRPKGFLALSYGVRLAVALGGFWLVLRKDVPAFLVAFAAFLLVRMVMIRKLRPSGGKNSDAAES